MRGKGEGGLPFGFSKKGVTIWGSGEEDWGRKEGEGQLLLTPSHLPPIYLYTQIPLLPVINKWGERGGGVGVRKTEKRTFKDGKDAGSWAKRKKPLAYLRFINISPPLPPRARPLFFIHTKPTTTSDKKRPELQARGEGGLDKTLSLVSSLPPSAS